jgi:hypothetical protein
MNAPITDGVNLVSSSENQVRGIYVWRMYGCSEQHVPTAVCWMQSHQGKQEVLQSAAWKQNVLQVWALNVPYQLLKAWECRTDSAKVA